MGFLDLFRSKPAEPARAEWLASTVQAVAAQAQGRMLQDLRAAGQRSFETAETPAWTDSWSTSDVQINDALSRQLPTLWSRASGLARNNEWAQSYLISLDDNVLGHSGIALQMQIKTSDGSKDAEANAALESTFALWGKNADVSGLSWPEVESLALGTLARRGELLYRLGNTGPMKFQIQLLDPTLLDVTLHRDWQGRRIRGDLPTAYVTVGKHIRVPANEIRHKYLTEEIGQMRGIPWLTVGARRLWLLHDFEEAAAVASSNAAKRQGFFYTPDGAAPAGFADSIVSSVLDAAKAAGKVLTPDEIQTITAAAEKYSSTVPGQFDTLPHGVQFQAFESAWPNVDAGSYVKQQIRGWAGARGMSYVTLGNDLEAVNYSSARVGILAEREHFKKVQARLRDWLHAEVMDAALPYLVLASRTLDPTRLEEYRAAVSWQPRRWAGIDPVKEANAAETNLNLKLTSRRRLILERGEDPDEIAAEVAAEDALYGEIDPSPNLAETPDVPDEESAVQQKAKLRLAAG